MQRVQLHEILKRAAEVCPGNLPVVFGSQAVHALTTSPPAEVLLSAECDLWLRDEPEAASRLAAELGKDSPFARDAGIYVDLLPPGLPLLPDGWENRLVDHDVGALTARCLEIHDLIISKLAAGRLKDYEFIAAVIMGKLADPGEVTRRIQTFAEPRTQAVLLARWRIASEATGVIR